MSVFITITNGKLDILIVDSNVAPPDDRGGGDDGDEPAGPREPGRTNSGTADQSLCHHYRLHLLSAPEHLQKPLLDEQSECLPSDQHFIRREHVP